MGTETEGNKKWALSKGDVIELEKHEKELKAHEDFAREDLGEGEDQKIPYGEIKKKNETAQS